MSYEVVLIDTTKIPIERQKNQKYFNSGKKKRHTLKSQVVVDKKVKGSFVWHLLMVSDTTYTYLKNVK